MMIYVLSLDAMHSVKHALDEADVEITSAIYSRQQETTANASNFILWREGQVKVMVATSAFGLATCGKSSALVSLYSVEDFAQMMGRAGHDGEPVVALALFDYNAEVARSHQLNTTTLGDMLHFATMQQMC